jgi:hypothetical protein
MRVRGTVTAVKIRVFVRFEVLAALTMKNVIFLDIPTYNQVEIHRCFGGTYFLSLQNGPNNQQVGQTSIRLHYVISQKIFLFLPLFIYLFNKDTGGYRQCVIF